MDLRTVFSVVAPPMSFTGGLYGLAHFAPLKRQGLDGTSLAVCVNISSSCTTASSWITILCFGLRAFGVVLSDCAACFPPTFFSLRFSCSVDVVEIRRLFAGAGLGSKTSSGPSDSELSRVSMRVFYSFRIAYSLENGITPTTYLVLSSER